jgi:hypothetical protein
MMKLFAGNTTISGHMGQGLLFANIAEALAGPGCHRKRWVPLHIPSGSFLFLLRLEGG